MYLHLFPSRRYSIKQKGYNITVSINIYNLPQNDISFSHTQFYDKFLTSWWQIHKYYKNKSTPTKIVTDRKQVLINKEDISA